MHTFQLLVMSLAAAAQGTLMGEMTGDTTILDASCTQ